ncbi:hypothetical protein sscle_05g048550 [Sclerotinia sclerotiorum 1980 UF-70]|uniref:Zn(2)-C6 fungal-type domain-containing protein n=1 Tax=Sclerotinia sclerotiorum (strain ATCC 18683 / 1980 / Ss-1) TaxID=665079 RepID=A0A1D9Q572_SCLS1|nr:hypothetical protein sscle_05g048550 [Sclerotinia sclerotiorum 1980 UF-70]
MFIRIARPSGEAAKKIQRRSRPLPRLRTKTGCLTCRQRRKKCDESKPRCMNCTRNKVDCCWGETPFRQCSNGYEMHKPFDNTASSSSYTTSSDTLSDLPKPKWLSVLCQTDGKPRHSNYYPNPIKSPSEDDHYLMLVYYQREVIPSTTHKYAHPGYLDYSYQFSWLSTYPTLSIATAASAAMHLSMTQPRYRNIALEYYNKAIRGVRQMISEGVVDGTEDWILGTVILFDLIERWRLDGLPNAGEQHLLTAIHLFKTRRQHKKVAQTSSQVGFERLCAESILYHSAHILLSSDYSILESHLGLIRELKGTCEAIPFPDSTVWSVSPTLGVPFAVFELILQIAILCRSKPSTASFGSFWQQLNDLDMTHRSIPPTNNRNDEIGAQNYTFSTQLYIVAAKILLNCAFEAQVSPAALRTLLQDGILAVAMVDTSTPLGRFYCWPVSVLRSIAEREAEVIFLDQKLASIENASGCGYTRTLMDDCKMERARRTVN